MNRPAGPGWDDDAPTERLPVGAGSRNRPATVALVLAAVAAAFLLLPATVPFAGLLSLAVLLCAVIAVWRCRGGRRPYRGRAVTALVAGPVLLVVAALLTPAPVPPTTVSAAAVPTAPASAPAAATVAPPGPAVASPVVPPSPVASAPVTGLAPTTTERVAPVQARAVPQRAPATTSAPASAGRATTAEPAPAPSRVVRKSATPPPARKSAPPATACDQDTHYVNSAGNCVRRPTAAPSAPAGATARCGDGTYSFSQSRSGTCSRHGGVASWL